MVIPGRWDAGIEAARGFQPFRSLAGLSTVPLSSLEEPMRFTMSVPGAFLLLVAPTQAVAPEYAVGDNTLRRAAGGGYEVNVAKDLKYVGGKRFHIRTSADAEQHLFAE